MIKTLTSREIARILRLDQTEDQWRRAWAEQGYPLWATTEEVAGYFGVSILTVRIWYKSGRIPGVKIGRRIMYDLPAIHRLFTEVSATRLPAYYQEEAQRREQMERARRELERDRRKRAMRAARARRKVEARGGGK